MSATFRQHGKAMTGVILAGGPSSRMGGNKALLPCRGGLFIETIHRQLAGIFPDLLLVTNTPDQYPFIPCPTVADLVPGAGPLAGIHAALRQSTHEHIFVVACDMPCLNAGLIRHLASLATGHDVVIPYGEKGGEALHAIYGKGALPAIAAALTAGQRRIISFFDQVRVRRVEWDEIARFDPAGTAFLNINTPEEYYRFRGQQLATNAGRPYRQSVNDAVVL